MAWLTGEFFGNQPRDRSRSTGHVHKRQCRTSRAYHKGCEGLLNQRTVDCCIKWVGCKGLKRKLIGFLRLKEAHECHLFSLRCYGSIWREGLARYFHSSEERRGGTHELLLDGRSQHHTSQLQSHFNLV